MTGEKKELVLIGSEINTRDYFTAPELEGKNFNDIIDLLYKKYEENIISFASENLSNIKATKDRIAIKFKYVDASGDKITIEPSDEVLNIMEITDTVNWSIETFGG